MGPLPLHWLGLIRPAVGSALCSLPPNLRSRLAYNYAAAAAADLRGCIILGAVVHVWKPANLHLLLLIMCIASAEDYVGLSCTNSRQLHRVCAIQQRGQEGPQVGSVSASRTLRSIGGVERVCGCFWGGAPFSV